MNSTLADDQPYYKDIPVTEVDFGTEDFVADPYVDLRPLQDQSPIFWHAPSERYLVTRYQDVSRVLGDTESFGEDHEIFLKLFGGNNFLTFEGERHTEVRGIWAKAFSRPNVMRQYTALVCAAIEAEVDTFADRLRSGEKVDAVGELIRPIPTSVIARVLGVPDEDIPQFIRWSDALGATVANSNVPSGEDADIAAGGGAATTELNAYVATEINRRRSQTEPSDDLIGIMLDHPVSATMDEADIIACITQLVFAGNETTAKLMAIVVNALAQFPDQREIVRNDRSSVSATVEEVHRWNSVAFGGPRIVRRPEGATVAGFDLPSGASVVALRGLANRDPMRWENPDVLDISRRRLQHLGFGYGEHNCLGQSLARLEVETFLNRMLDNLPQWHIEGDPDWGLNWALRGPQKLVVSAT
nr:cytochrome P450 hydroxylase [Rhodococcus wratislaviensis]